MEDVFPSPAGSRHTYITRHFTDLDPPYWPHFPVQTLRKASPRRVLGMMDRRVAECGNACVNPDEKFDVDRYRRLLAERTDDKLNGQTTRDKKRLALIVSLRVEHRSAFWPNCLPIHFSTGVRLRECIPFAHSPVSDEIAKPMFTRESLRCDKLGAWAMRAAAFVFVLTLLGFRKIVKVSVKIGAQKIVWEGNT